MLFKPRKKEFKKAKDISATFRDRVAKGIEGDVFGLESGSSTYKKQSGPPSSSATPIFYYDYLPSDLLGGG